MKTVCVTVCADIEADFLVGQLEANGIRAVAVPHGEAVVSTVVGGAQSVEIWVREQDAEAALALLGEPARDLEGRRRPTGVRQAHTQHGNSNAAQNYSNRMISGLVKMTVGITLAIATYRLSNETGGVYIIWWGAILWGLVDFVAGLAAWLKRD